MEIRENCDLSKTDQFVSQLQVIAPVKKSIKILNDRN